MRDSANPGLFCHLVGPNPPYTYNNIYTKTSSKPYEKYFFENPGGSVAQSMLNVTLTAVKKELKQNT